MNDDQSAIAFYSYRVEQPCTPRVRLISILNLWPVAEHTIAFHLFQNYFVAAYNFF